MECCECKGFDEHPIQVNRDGKSLIFCHVCYYHPECRDQPAVNQAKVDDGDRS